MKPLGMALRAWMLENIRDDRVHRGLSEETDVRDQRVLGIHESWLRFLDLSPGQIAHLKRVGELVSLDRARDVVYPEPDDVHRWSRLCDPRRVRVVIVGQDPYPEGSASGLAFGTVPGGDVPPSLMNIFRELARTVDDFDIPSTGCLDAWCREGVLLLNSVFTVLRGRPGSHGHLGWQTLCDGVIRTLSDRRDGLVFMLWGTDAQRKEHLIDATRHLILKSAHPSPRAQSSKTPFLGNGHFASANEYLSRRGDRVDWTVLTRSTTRETNT